MVEILKRATIEEMLQRTADSVRRMRETAQARRDAASQPEPAITPRPVTIERVGALPLPEPKR